MRWYESKERVSDPSHEDFERNWLTPAQAFGHLSKGMTPGLASVLTNRLKSKALLAAAREARWEAVPGKFIPRIVTTIDPSWWAHVEEGLAHDSPLWLHGDATIMVPGPARGARPTRVLFCDIRFEPDALRQVVPLPEMAPKPPPAPKPALAITEAEYDSWYSPHVAVETLKAVGYDPANVYSAILYRVTADELRAVAKKVIVDARNMPSVTRQYEILPPDRWAITSIQPGFWDSGDVIFHRVLAGGREFTFACTGIRFDPAGIDALAAQRRPPRPDTRSAYTKAADAVTLGLQSALQAFEDKRTWLSARQAVDLVGTLYPRHPEVHAQRAIVDAAAGELIAARSRRRIIEDEDGDQDREDNGAIALGFWALIRAASHTQADWRAGNFAARQRPEGGIGWEMVRHYGVEFCEEDLRAAFDLSASLPGTDSPGIPLRELPQLLARSLQDSPAAPKEPRPRPVTETEIKTWHRGLTKAQKSLGVTDLWALAKLHYPGRHLPRKMVEHYGKDRGNGHRAMPQEFPGKFPR